MTRSPAATASRTHCSAVGGAVDPVQHVERPARGTPVQRARQRADGSAHGAGQVRTGRGDDPGGEGRGVESVVHGQDQVLLERPHLSGHQLRAGDHQADGSRRDPGRPGAPGVVHRGAGGSAAATMVGTTAPSCSVWSTSSWRATSRVGPQPAGVAREHRHGRSQHLERGAVRQLGEGPVETCRQCPQGCDPLLELRRLRGVGQVVVDHQVPDVLEGPTLGELHRGVLAVVEEPFGPPHVTEPVSRPPPRPRGRGLQSSSSLTSPGSERPLSSSCRHEPTYDRRVEL